VLARAIAIRHDAFKPARKKPLSAEVKLKVLTTTM
jgi:hypothetical protein